MLLTVLLIWAGFPLSPRAQTVSGNIVGFINRRFPAGDNLIGNPFDASTNTVRGLLTGSFPNGASFSKWDSATGQYLSSSVFTSGVGWSIDYPFLPGEGALLHLPSPATNIFKGNVVGSMVGGNISPLPAPTQTNGVYLLSSSFPLDGRTFDDLTGRPPHEGETVLSFSSTSHLYVITTYRSGAWDNGSPTLNIGEAAFFNLGPVSISLSNLLNVPVPPFLSAPLRLDGRFSVSLSTARGRAYCLEFKTSLADPDWTPVASDPGSGAPQLLSDPAAVGPQRFYRVRVE